MSHAIKKWDRHNTMLLQINRTTSLIQSLISNGRFWRKAAVHGHVRSLEMERKWDLETFRSVDDPNQTTAVHCG